MESSTPEEHASASDGASTESSSASVSAETGAPAEPAGGPAEPAQAEEDEASSEHTRLEALLSERASELAATRQDLASAKQLLRDALSRFDRLPPAPAVDTAGLAELRRERDRALSRALEAEAARAEIMFRLDEVMGHLAVQDVEPAARSAAEEDHARLSGTTRGLQSALAEAQEARDVAQARLMLAEADLEDAADDRRRVQRELEETREQLELELLKSRSDASATKVSELRGELDGALARAAEAEDAVAAAQAGARSATAAAEDLREQLGAVRAELAESEVQRTVLGSRLDAAEQEREGGDARARDLAAQLSSVEQRLAERSETLQRLESELTSFRSERKQREQEARAGDSRLEELAEEHRRARAGDQARLRQLTDGLAETREILARLSSDVRAALGAEPSAAEPAGEPTLPGTPIEFEAIEAMEALEEQVATRDDRIKQLQGQLTAAVEAHARADDEHARTVEGLRDDAERLRVDLARSEGRDRAVEAGLRSLRDALEQGSPLQDRLQELIGLLER